MQTTNFWNLDWYGDWGQVKAIRTFAFTPFGGATSDHDSAIGGGAMFRNSKRTIPTWPLEEVESRTSDMYRLR